MQMQRPVQCSQLFARDRVEREQGRSTATAAPLNGFKIKLRFAIKSETRLQSLVDCKNIILVDSRDS